jgi:RNA polymerase sigma-70 factor, ECF subfamily
MNVRPSRPVILGSGPGDTGSGTPRGDVDIELILKAQGGDEEAFAALVPSTAERLLGVAYRILRDHAAAEDATQAALITAWRTLPRLRDPGRFEAWTYRLVVNACHDQSRQRRLVSLELDPDRGDGSNDPSTPDSTTSIADRDWLERAFESLSMPHRVVIVLHHHSGIPLVDIARMLGVPEGTVRSRLHYALGALRAALLADNAPQVERAAS